MFLNTEPGETSESDDIEEVLDENEESKPKNEDEVTKSEVHNSPDSGAGSENAEKNTENIDFPFLEVSGILNIKLVWCFQITRALVIVFCSSV